MGFGGLFHSGPSSAQINVQNDYQAVAAAEQAQQQQQAAANAAAAAQDRQTIATTQQQFSSSISNKAAEAAVQLGILNYIKTSPEGLSNSPKTGRLTLLGN
ncbi:MAG TPA: hypothetical protein V6D22_13625 [Candidatus Obscuribacterales bacterium]